MLRGSTGLGAAEAGSGVVDLTIASGRELMRLQRCMTGKHSELSELGRLHKCDCHIVTEVCVTRHIEFLASAWS